MASGWTERVVQREPAHCPYCGTELVTREYEGRPRAYCPDEDRVIWRNAVPLACGLVVDAGRVLLVDAASKPGYTVPGGHPEHDERPRRAVVRELAEETNLEVDPTDTNLFDVRWLDASNGIDYWATYFLIDRRNATGRVEAGDDARETAWFDADELRADDRPHPDAVSVASDALRASDDATGT